MAKTIKINEYVKANAELLMASKDFHECGTLLFHLSMMPVYHGLKRLDAWEEMYGMARQADVDWYYGMKVVDDLYKIGRHNLYGVLDEAGTRRLMREFEKIKATMKMPHEEIADDDGIEW